MIVLLMAAGAGKRMNSAVPKPFIDVKGKQMWMYVAEKLGLGKNDTLQRVLVMQEKHRKWLDVDKGGDHLDEISKYVEEVTYIPDMEVAGPAWSVVAATLTTRPSQPILILDTDCWVEPTPMGHRDIMSGSQITQICRMHPHWDTYCMVFGIRVFEDMTHAAEITMSLNTMVIREGGVKKGGLLNVGAYWFRSVEDFRVRLSSVKKEGEVKISDVVNVDVRSTEVMTLTGKFVNIGTEELLKSI